MIFRDTATTTAGFPTPAPRQRVRWGAILVLVLGVVAFMIWLGQQPTTASMADEVCDYRAAGHGHLYEARQLWYGHPGAFEEKTDAFAFVQRVECP